MEGINRVFAEGERDMYLITSGILQLMMLLCNKGHDGV